MANDRSHCNSFGRVAFAFLTGASVATTAILLTNQVRKAGSAEHLLKKCSRAVEALDSQVRQPAANA